MASRKQTPVTPWSRGRLVAILGGAAVAAVVRGLTGRRVTLTVDGGVLEVDWRDDGVWLSGPVAYVFEGVLSPDLLEGAA